jgi:tetratricopeptide (TPR) repeat protein
LKKTQLITILTFLILLIGSYYGCETKSKNQKVLEKSRAINFEKVSPRNLIKSEKDKLDSEAIALISTIEAQLKQSNADSLQKNDALERLASSWFSLGSPAVSGIYAEEIAKIKENADAWGIAGTTYLLCLKSADNTDTKDFCFNRSVKALEKAISYDPQNVDHQINLALCYVEKPLEENPMKGIMMLLELNRSNPDNVPVLLQIGKLALQTNQVDKAIGRFESVLKLDAENIEAHCYLADLYGQSNVDKAKFHKEYCKQ